MNRNWPLEALHLPSSMDLRCESLRIPIKSLAVSFASPSRTQKRMVNEALGWIMVSQTVVAGCVWGQYGCDNRFQEGFSVPASLRAAFSQRKQLRDIRSDLDHPILEVFWLPLGS